MGGGEKAVCVAFLAGNRGFDRRFVAFPRFHVAARAPVAAHVAADRGGAEPQPCAAVRGGIGVANSLGLRAGNDRVGVGRCGHCRPGLGHSHLLRRAGVPAPAAFRGGGGETGGGGTGWFGLFVSIHDSFAHVDASLQPKTLPGNQGPRGAL